MQIRIKTALNHKALGNLASGVVAEVDFALAWELVLGGYAEALEDMGVAPAAEKKPLKSKK